MATGGGGDDIIVTQHRVREDQKSSANLVAKLPKFANESKRLKTYVEWKGVIPAQVLAKAGLIYTGGGDIVKCYHCGKELGGWEQSDDPEQAHAQYSPKCPLVTKRKQSEKSSERPVQEQLRVDKPVISIKNSREELENENAQMKQKLMCKHCRQRIADAVILPCGHLEYCQACTQNDCRICPTCRKHVTCIIIATWSADL